MSGLQFALASLAVLATLLTGTARADDAVAELAIAHGVSLRREHRDTEALAEFRRAYAEAPTPRALAQIGLAEAALDQWVSAEVDLLRALASDDLWIAKQRQVLRLALDEIDAHLGTLEVTGPEGGELWIDGALAGRLPRPSLRVPAKHLSLELRAPGFETARREIDPEPRITMRIAFALEGAQTAPAAVETRFPVATASAERPPPKPARTRTFAWLAAGGAAVFLSAGVGLSAYALDRAGHYNHDTACNAPDRSATCPKLRSAALTAQTAAVTSYAVGGAAALTSAILFLIPTKDVSTRSSLQCAPLLGGATCRYVF
ncbi:MAG TPA: PEGA domain-containing protein [Polyangiaceae bacterium]|jgi:hypothetical protein|nr:PEGA domain-containing protein [Polyangiaceae bacterium]